MLLPIWVWQKLELKKGEMLVKFKKSNKKGYVSMEFVIGLFVLILVWLVFTGIFTYYYPRQKLEKEMVTLVQQAKVNGGLTDSNIRELEERVNAMGLEVVSLEAFTKTQTALGVAERNSGYAECVASTPYIQRRSGDIIYIELVVSASDDLVKTPLQYFGSIGLPENYTLVDSTLSERNGC